VAAVCNVKVKCALLQALRLCKDCTAHTASRDIALLFHDRGTGGCGWSAARPGRNLPPGKTRYPFYRRLSVPQGRSGQVRKISSPPGFDPRTVHPVAQSLYRLSYPVHICIYIYYVLNILYILMSILKTFSNPPSIISYPRSSVT
jgi:hypothetical protein